MSYPGEEGRTTMLVQSGERHLKCAASALVLRHDDPGLGSHTSSRSATAMFHADAEPAAH
jgi:hypothetical protein